MREEELKNMEGVSIDNWADVALLTEEHCRIIGCPFLCVFEESERSC